MSKNNKFYIDLKKQYVPVLPFDFPFLHVWHGILKRAKDQTGGGGGGGVEGGEIRVDKNVGYLSLTFYLFKNAMSKLWSV